MKLYFAIITLFLSLEACQSTTRHNKVLPIKEIVHKGTTKLDEVSQLLEDNTVLNTVKTLNWKEYPYQPDVKFRIAHNKEEIWLKFYVEEANILARHTAINSATHLDSCVEFFIDPKQDGNYYNFEFNCIGTTRIAYGPNRYQREFIPENIIKEKIKIASSLGDKPFEEKTGGHQWEMTVVIPADIFIFDNSVALKGLIANANFYKCGDNTSLKHFLSWNPVESELPDFHRPECFGELIFE